LGYLQDSVMSVFGKIKIRGLDYFCLAHDKSELGGGSIVRRNFQENTQTPLLVC